MKNKVEWIKGFGSIKGPGKVEVKTDKGTQLLETKKYSESPPVPSRTHAPRSHAGTPIPSSPTSKFSTSRPLPNPS